MSSLKKCLPNILTFSRLGFLAISAFLVAKGWYFLSFFPFIMGAMTDILDGYLARKFKAVTKLGYYLDHIFDSIYVGLIFYLIFSYLSIWLFSTALFLRLATICLSAAAISQNIKNWPNIWGKISFGFMIACGCTILLGFYKLAATILIAACLLRFISLILYMKEEVVRHA
jgi:CDP-diacylglycerol--glycerol-3-phosphate 3-phosphatidyltransferase